MKKFYYGMKSLGKRPLLTFNVVFDPDFREGSSFIVENKFVANEPVYIPSAMLRRNFPQSKTNTRLKILFFPFEVDAGRTIWLKWFNSCFSNLLYTFSRKGKVVASEMPYGLQQFLKSNLKIKNTNALKLKMYVEAI